jgi:hypothetical protein
MPFKANFAPSTNIILELAMVIDLSATVFFTLFTLILWVTIL